MNNNLLIYFFISLVIVVGLTYLLKTIKRRKRSKLYTSPFPEHWIEILENNFQLYNKLPNALKRQLHGHMHIFLEEKNYVGYNGIIIDETIKITIAAQACILLLNRKTNYYPHLKNILIYPSAFTHSDNQGNKHIGRLGESWQRGPIVLSWKHSLSGGKNDNDGSNVIIHEFAHQLDQENGPSDGLPILQHNNIKQWSGVLSKEFKTLKLKLKLRKKSLLDKYGATNPAEFFAVITEHFIEQPQQFKKKHPDLYEELLKYYQMDPLEWK
ncbi:MAG: zinc-dependent peptidase [Marinicellaceae bacterium]